MGFLRRFAALALCGLLLAGLLGAHVHRLAAVHAVCSKHGELIHVETGAAALGQSPAATAFASGDTVEFQGAHGCAALLLLATALVGPAPAAPTLTLRAEPDRRPARAPIAAPRPVPLLLQAPKLSPPAA
jgi:hypothetical protein